MKAHGLALCACLLGCSVTSSSTVNSSNNSSNNKDSGPRLEVSCADACSHGRQLCQDEPGFTDTWEQACVTSCETKVKLTPDAARQLTNCLAEASACGGVTACLSGVPADAGVDESKGNDSVVTMPDLTPDVTPDLPPDLTPDLTPPDFLLPDWVSDVTPSDVLAPDTSSTSPVRDYGLPCNGPGNCLDGDCYVPGTQDNPICSKKCLGDGDCPGGSRCVEMGGTGKHCFVSCTGNALCLSINDDPANPLQCLSLPEGGICIQSSEP